MRSLSADASVFSGGERFFIENVLQYRMRDSVGDSAARCEKWGAKMVYIIMVCIAAPLLLLMTLLDKKSRWIVGFMILGMLMAVCAYEINTLCGYLFQMNGVEISLVVAPIIEEVLKALPILFFAVFISDQRHRVLPLAMSVGIGFAILENAFLLINYVDQVDIVWAIIRGISTSLSHGICTLIVGCGMIFVRKQKKLFYTGTFALLTAAMTFHAIFNLLLQSRFDYVGLAMPIFIYTVAWIVKLSKKD